MYISLCIYVYTYIYIFVNVYRALDARIKERSISFVFHDFGFEGHWQTIGKVNTTVIYILYTVDLVTSWLLKKTKNRAEFCKSCVWHYFGHARTAKKTEKSNLQNCILYMTKRR